MTVTLFVLSGPKPPIKAQPENSGVAASESLNLACLLAATTAGPPLTGSAVPGSSSDRIAWPGAGSVDSR